MSEEIAVENLDPDMTCRDLVRLFFGDVSDREADHFLWSATAFPLNDLEGLVAGIRKMHERSDGSIEKAVRLAHEDMDRAYEEYLETKEATQ